MLWLKPFAFPGVQPGCGGGGKNLLTLEATPLPEKENTFHKAGSMCPNVLNGGKG